MRNMPLEMRVKLDKNCQDNLFFHFRWNSLRAGHVSIRAQEKTSSHFFITKNTCHAHSRPFQAKHAQKMSGKKLP